MERFSASVHFDAALWRQDIRGSIAHARMLGEQSIISKEEAETLIKGLEQIAVELEKGRLALNPGLEDIHTNIEHRLGELVGPVAGKLHSGRSRNDQIATDFTMWMREAIGELRLALLGLRGVLVERAGNEIDIVMPGYTHLQRAQPVRLAHHWLAHYEALVRDEGRLCDAASRLNRAPLGSGALAGSTLALDRESTARELGFEGPTRNSLDSVSARDGALELLSTLSILMIHLSRICEELVLWSSTEFGFVEMDDAFSTGSSLMPQKKNSDAAELVRGKSGRVVGGLISLLVSMKGLPLTYNRDMQEDKEPVFDAVRTVGDSLEVLGATLASLHVHREAMEAAASDPMLLATDLADLLVERGVPFREAHEVVGQVVARSTQTGTPLSEMRRESLLEFHSALDIDPTVFFSVERSLEARRTPGSPSREQVGAALEVAREELERTASELRS